MANMRTAFMIESGISTVLLSSGHVRESTGHDIFLASQGAFQALKAQATRGVWRHAPQEIFKNEHSETLFPAFLETKYQFPRQG